MLIITDKQNCLHLVRNKMMNPMVILGLQFFVIVWFALRCQVGSLKFKMGL